MKHIAENYFNNHAECSELITWSEKKRNFTLNIVLNRCANLHRDKKFFFRAAIATIFINLVFIAAVFSQLMTSNNVSITISAGTQLTVQGTIQNETGASMDNSGTIDLSGDWIHNASNNCFGTSQGAVILNGANQTIGGTSTTTFNDLLLMGSGTKTLGINTITGGSAGNGVCNVGSSTLDLNSKTLIVTNSTTAGISATSGIITSEDTDNSSKVQWNIGSTTGNHTVPFGNLSGSPVGLSIALTSGDIGNVTVSTYGTPPANTPYPVTPVTVTQLNDYAGNDNSANVVDRFWEVDKTGPSGTADLAFLYAGTELPANGSTNLRAQRWNNANLGWEAPLLSQANTSTLRVVVNGVTAFGPWTVVRATSPLPVELLRFEAQVNKNKLVDLNWTTAAEVNNDFFTVERSKDALNFEYVSRIDGAGNSNQLLRYNSVDNAPYKGISYYRLRQTDYNGESTYSDIRSVNISDDNTRIEVFPNPVTDFVNINSSSDDLLNIKLADANGKLILRRDDVKQNLKINFTDYASGNYYLVVSNSIGDNIKTFKLVKN